MAHSSCWRLLSPNQRFFFLSGYKAGNVYIIVRIICKHVSPNLLVLIVMQPLFFRTNLFLCLGFSSSPARSWLCSSGPVDVSSNELMGNIGEVKGRDVVIVDELIDTGGTLAALPLRLKKAGAMVRD